MTIHRSKSELKQLRYPENCARRVSSLPKTITFDLTIGFLIYLVLWKLDIQLFLVTPRIAQLEFSLALKYVIEVRTKSLEEKEKIANVSSFHPTATKGPPAQPGTP